MTSQTDFGDKHYHSTFKYTPVYLNEKLKGAFRSHQLSLLLDTAFIDISRDILSQESIGGVNERYQYIITSIGVNWVYQYKKKLTVEAAFVHGVSIDASMDVDFLNQYNKKTHPLNSITVNKISGKLSYSIDKNYIVSLSALVKKTFISRSDEDVLTSKDGNQVYFHQPQREGLTSQLSFELKYLF